MIRRGFWLLAGAAGGIMGYRRVSSLTRQVSETLGRTRSRSSRRRPRRGGTGPARPSVSPATCGKAWTCIPFGIRARHGLPLGQAHALATRDSTAHHRPR